MIIKDLQNCCAETLYNLKVLEASSAADPAKLEHMRRKMVALKELNRFVAGGKWTREASREKYKALCKSNFDYKLIADRFNTTRESLDVFAVRQDKRLKGFIGEALQLIKLNRIDEGLDCFYTATGEFSDREFSYRASELLPEVQKKDSFLVSDCAMEIEILRSFMRSSVEKKLNGGDLEKLGYLVFLLRSEDSTFKEQRSELIRKLRKKDS